jgi:RNA polymerase sigma-70 factor (ECF subfamily)
MSQVLPPRPLEEYRDYLRALVRLLAAPGKPGRVDDSDAVQETLLLAHQHRDQFRGRSEPEFRGWLRQILLNHLASLFRRANRPGGDAVVQALPVELDQQAAQVEASPGDLPDEQAAAIERLARLAAALDRLPDDQRQAIELHHLQGLSVPETAQRMTRTTASVAGLVRRGAQALRVLLGNDD